MDGYDERKERSGELFPDALDCWKSNSKIKLLISTSLLLNPSKTRWVLKTWNSLCVLWKLLQTVKIK